jgi:hypothetical protein
MLVLNVQDAAARLGVGPATLTAWERHFAFPQRLVSEDGAPGYAEDELAALHDALATSMSVAAAIAHARARHRPEERPRVH